MKLDVMQVDEWDVWEKEISRFSWRYEDTETCCLLEGEAVVTADDGECVLVREGDLVTFLPGLSCTWNIRRPIRKHYKIG